MYGKAPKATRKNKPRATARPHEWPDAVWQKLDLLLEQRNRNSQGNPYWVERDMVPDAALPPALEDDRCHNPFKSARVTVCYKDRQYQIALHRARLFLRLRRNGLPLPCTKTQASHLCMDMINTDGKGNTHCCNPDHQSCESDGENKDRQRCAGWIWVHTHRDNPGGFWYPTCLHKPPCKRFTPKDMKPTELRQ